jgi:type VI secretion system protein VasJ
VADLETLRARTKGFLEAIPGASPAGAPARLDPAYQLIANEVAKLDAPSGGAVDWKAVVQGAGELLRTKSKDVVLAAFLAHGLQVTQGIDGLATGIGVVADLLDGYWDTAFPEVKRLRGRVNAIQWLLERSRATLPAVQAGAAEGPAVSGLEVAAQRLAEVVRARFADQAPAMGPLLDEVARLKGEVEAATATPEPARAPESAALPQGATAAPAAAPPRAAAAPLPDAPGGLADAAQAVDYLRNVGTALASAAAILRAADATEPLSYRVLRTGVWLHMQAPPAGTGGKTAVPPPPEPLRKQLATLSQNQKWAALVEEAEAALPQCRFWLDLHRHTAQALAALGAGHARAREAVLVEVRAFLARMPSIPTLAFADGAPLADPQTRTWLDEEVAPRAAAPAAAGAAAEDPAALEVIATARKQLTGGQVAEALAALRVLAASRPDGRGRFRVRLELAKAAAGAGLTAVARATYDELDRDAVAHRLDEWEPAVAADVLKGLIAATRALVNDPRGVKEGLVPQYQRLCRLDPAAALEVWP